VASCAIHHSEVAQDALPTTKEYKTRELHGDTDDGNTAVTVVMGLNIITNTAVSAGCGSIHSSITGATTELAVKLQ